MHVISGLQTSWQVILIDVYSFIPKATLSWQKLGLEEPGNNTKNTLVPYVPIDTVVTTEINIYKHCTRLLFGARPQIQ